MTTNRRRVTVDMSDRTERQVEMDQPHDAGPLRIELINSKIGTLERRIGHLKRRLEDDSRRATASADYDRAEISALEAACRALRYHAAHLTPESDPVLALDELASAAQVVLGSAEAMAGLSQDMAERVGRVGATPAIQNVRRLREALARAQQVLEVLQ